MSSQDMDILARKIVSLEKRHNALARARQLPNSSVRLAEGEDVMLSSAIQNGEDAYNETGIIGERADSIGDLIDSEAEYDTSIPDWIESSAHTGDSAWDGAQIALDKASEVETIVEELTNVPNAPIGLTELSNVGAFTSVGARAEVGVSWTEVVTSVKDEPIGVDVYRVYVDGALRVEETQPPTTISIPSGVSAEIRVSAVSEGLESDRSEALNITGALPTVANLTPTKPVLSTALGNVRAVWDGLYTTPTLPGAHTVRVEARVGSDAWVQQGAALSGAGDQLVSVGEIGDAVEVRFRAFDQLGRLTGTSVEATVTVVGIEIPDLDQSVSDMLADMETDISDALDTANAAQGTANTASTAADQAAAAALAAANAASAAQTAANAKGKVIIQSAAPAAADRLPQNLWIDTTDGANTPKRWVSGTTWVAVTDKAATDAAAAAVTAKNAADTAQARADSAFTTATNAATAAGQAQTTANGKNRVWYTNTAPPGTNHKIDDVWFDGANGNRINTWSGSAWVVRQMGTDAIANLAITNALIANGTIQNAKIANLDAAKISTGTLNADRIGANSIDVTKLLVQGANLVPNPTFETLTGWTVGGGLAPALSTTTRGRAVYFGRSVSVERTLTSQEIYVAGETTYTVGALVLRQVGTPSPELRLEVVPVNSAGVEQTPVVVATHSGSSASWTSIYGQYTVPASSYRSIKFRFVAGATTATSGNDYLVQPRIVQTSVGEMIVDGAVKARHVEMDTGFADKFWANEGNFGKIKVDYVEPNFGDSLDITANESINFMVGEIADVQDVADTAATTAETAATEAANASSQAALADGKALVAQNQVQGVSDRLTAQQAVFRVTATGAEVASKDGSNVVQINPTGVSIVQGGSAASTWDAGRLIVSEAVVSRARLANHLVEKSGTNRTIFRPI